MTLLSNEEKELIFDYCLGVASEERAAQAQQLVSSNPEATKLHSQFKNALEPLNSLQPERCPDHLAEGTVFRLNNLARSSQVELENLLAGEQHRQVAARRGFWRNFAEVAAVAAVIIFFASVSIPSLNAARQEAWKTYCQAQLGRIATAMTQYTSDNEGTLPSVATATGAPWWKVGYQGTENHSNTRHLWLLVKDSYAEPADFVCPGRSQGRAVGLHRVHVEKLLDFPSRRNVTYSFRIIPAERIKQLASGHRVLMADLSPIFEKSCKGFDGPLTAGNEFATVKLCKKLRNMNSRNHAERGQNVMFADGSVEFRKQRTTEISLDDMFTVRGKDSYRGCEMPASDDDVFLAP